MKHSVIIAAALFGAGALMQTQPAQAAGCGGYVNVFVSGCAPWDNNPRRMPGAPGYVAPQPSRPVLSQPRPVVVRPPSGNSLISNNRAGLISDNGAVLRNSRTGLVGNDGASLRR